MSIELARPWVLALLPLVLLVMRAWARRPRAAFDWPAAQTLSPFTIRRIDRWRVLLRGAALSAGVIALAGPSWSFADEQIKAEGISVMLVLDVSGSMAEADSEWNGEKITRLESVKRAFREFIARRPQDRIGLVLFATHPETTLALSLDHSAIDRAIAAATPRGVPTENESNLGDAIAWGLDRLRARHGRGVMIVCSDGEHNVPAPAFTPRQAAQLAAATDVPIYTVFAGPPGGVGNDGLHAVASMTGGASFAASDSSNLDAAHHAIDAWERDLAHGARTHINSQGERWFAMAAFSLLALALAFDRGPWLITP